MKCRWASACAIMLLSAQLAVAQEVTPEAPEAATLQGYHEDVLVTADTQDQPSRRVHDFKFWTVGGLLGTAMLLDTKSTFDVLGRCARCYEANPYVAPFVNRGPGVTFTAGVALDVGIMAIAAKMKTSRHERFRRIWWVVPVVLTAGHLLAYRHNLRVGHGHELTPRP
jgi:hypothetical protein